MKLCLFDRWRVGLVGNDDVFATGTPAGGRRHVRGAVMARGRASRDRGKRPVRGADAPVLDALGLRFTEELAAPQAVTAEFEGSSARPAGSESSLG